MSYFLAQAARVTGKGAETLSTSQTAVSTFFAIIWDKIDNWIAALVVFGISIALANMFRRMVVEKIAQHLDEEHQDMLVLAGRATYVTVLGLGLTVGLKVAGIDITAIVAAIGFGLGFAMRDLVMNFIAGIILMITRNYTIGDFIKIDRTFGRITEIQGRATILKALDGTKVIVPNADLFSKMVTSYTSNPFRRLDVPVGVEYSTDLKKAIEVIRATLGNNPDIIKEPAPAVLLTEFSDSSINFSVRFWIDSKNNWWKIKSDVILQIKQAFDAVGITIPFPIRTLMFNEKKEEKMLAENIEDYYKTKEMKEVKANELSEKKIDLGVKADVALSVLPKEAPASSAEPKPPLGIVTGKKNPFPEDSGKSFLENK